MAYGNCVLGAIVVACRHHFRGRFLAIFRKGRWMPHVLFQGRDGRLHHFTNTRPQELAESFHVGIVLYPGRIRSSRGPVEISRFRRKNSDDSCHRLNRGL